MERLAERGWVVLLADLPGHGMSSGPRADIGSFVDYGRLERELLSWASDREPELFPHPWILLGHSLGGATVLEGLWSGEARADAAVLLAPLLYPAGNLAIPFAAPLSLFISGLPPFTPSDSYLGGRAMPLHWLRELGLWNRSFTARPRLDLPLLVIQGKADRVLDWKANLAILSEKAPGAKLLLLEGADHVLPVAGHGRDECLVAIEKYLDKLFPDARGSESRRSAMD
jgi:alpha-beta hydrolase superfamily lysophospholipase